MPEYLVLDNKAKCENRLDSNAFKQNHLSEKPRLKARNRKKIEQYFPFAQIF